MNLNDIGALVAFGRVGVALAASRMMSLVMGFGTVALAAYVIRSPSWEAVFVVIVVGLCGLLPALAFEARNRKEPAPRAE